MCNFLNVLSHESDHLPAKKQVCDDVSKVRKGHVTPPSELTVGHHLCNTTDTFDYLLSQILQTRWPGILNIFVSDTQSMVQNSIYYC